ncbi:MAG: hypothetical protein MI864_06455 [Pseudomonadales bacterium]|uniref:Uncharacterized protein n=1 Tax=Oleiphilus messinensis TaxID=141451 RepID=A0A1Y0I365_9GAMM|nr:hypothetical protein [Oleiphilus messinensis]ARU54948.1 hypothetical protein OLMES_0861 [Oleiphilus messinensis]MCG8610161.1 hypothetical protein [Pseudomonadales bacterium]
MKRWNDPIVGKQALKLTELRERDSFELNREITMELEICVPHNEEELKNIKWLEEYLNSIYYC